MPDPFERDIFLQAIEEKDLDDRIAYLDSACGDNHALRASVDALLAAHEKPAALLDHPIGVDQERPASFLLGVDEPVDHIGMVVGPYRLMEQIGEGGFGLVFVAQQEEPVRRRVALKIVKPGLASKEVVARFEAELQAVAMMEHPNIAQVFDAGVTRDGRPYFAMELIRGLPIVEFADKQGLGVAERIGLMVDVCSAVHHAHQKGVIHRDLKPSNIMVTVHDGRPIAKVIDFGVAKALGEKLTDKTVYTCFYSMIGTPLYMSPEQAEMSGHDVDTRSDIFSLGVVLYELLAGSTPFERDRLESAGLDELRRIIREEDPPLPSARLSTCGEARSTVADRRRIDPRALTSALRGDLDWIVMKSLDKDRSRRYDSAAALAEELRRFLAGEPVEARPPSISYLLRKYARRHRVAFLTAALVGATMVVGTTASLWLMSEAIAERNAKDIALQEAKQAKAEAIAAKRKVEQFAADQVKANELIASGQAHADAGRWKKALRDYDAAVKTQPSYHLPRIQRAQALARLRLWPEAAEDYAKALQASPSTSQPQWWGVPVLSLYTDHVDVFRCLSEQRRAYIRKNATEPQWMMLRDLAVSGDATSIPEFQFLLSVAHGWLHGPMEAGPPPPPHQRQDPPPHGPGGPGMPDRPPRPDAIGRVANSDESPLCVRQYITAMLHLRVGEPQEALVLFSDAERDPFWPSKQLIHAPVAIAHYQSGNTEQALKALDRSDTMLREQLLAAREWAPERARSPWFDVVEGVQLNSEATQLIRNAPSRLAPELARLRTESLERLNGARQVH